MSENAGIEPRTVATSALAVGRSGHSASSHPQLGYISCTSAMSHPLRLHLIHSATSHPQSATSHPLRLHLIHLGYISSTLATSHPLGYISSTVGYISNLIHLGYMRIIKHFLISSIESWNKSSSFRDKKNFTFFPKYNRLTFQQNTVTTPQPNTRLKVLANLKRGGLAMLSFDRSPFKLSSLKFSDKSAQAPSCERPKTTQRTLFLLFANINCFQITA